jgi:hypothetical protein
MWLVGAYQMQMLCCMCTSHLIIAAVLVLLWAILKQKSIVRQTLLITEVRHTATLKTGVLVAAIAKPTPCSMFHTTVHAHHHSL